MGIPRPFHPLGIGCGNGDDQRTRRSPESVKRRFCCSMECCVERTSTQALRAVEEVEDARERPVKAYALDNKSLRKPKKGHGSVKRGE